MAKRVYFETVKKWLIGAGITVGTLIGGLFVYLSFLGVIEITGYSGDMVCAGTELDPCYAYINLTVKEDIFIYPTDYDPWGRNTFMEFDPAVKSWKLQRSWGNGWRDIPLDKTCTGTWCGAPNNLGVKYSYVLREERDYQFRIVAYKNSPYDTIKWAVNYNDREYLDPAWYGIERDIGYEFLDNNKVVHIWNIHDDYYFNKSSGIQFTNHFQDYWTKNVFCIGYYNNNEWHKIKCADELKNFNRDIQTDNLTYVNATLWKDISYGNYDLRIGIQYHLKLEDGELSITIYGKNIGVDIPYDLGFAWKIKDVDIPGEGDNIYINDTEYNLNDTYNIIFNSLTESTLEIHNEEKYLWMDWNENLTYKVKMYANGNQEDFYVTTLINAGHFNPNQEKSTTFHWIDADVQIDDSVSSALHNQNTGRYLVWASPTTGYVFFVDLGTTFQYRKTTDSGATWSTVVSIKSSTQTFAIWYDKWTNGDTGDVIHIVYQESVNDNVYYNSFSTSDDNLDGEVVVYDGTSIDTAPTIVNAIAMTKSRGGTIYIGSWIDNDGENGFWKGNASPATSFDSLTSMADGNDVDYILFDPGAETDSDDIWGFYWDRSANEISLKVYDQSENSWSETSISGNMLDDTYYFHLDSCHRHTDNHSIFIAQDNLANSESSLLVWDIGGASSINSKTNLVTDSDDTFQGGIMINQKNDDLYAVYLGKDDGSERAEANVHVYYKLSEDGGDTWGSETVFSVTTDDHRLVTGGTSVDNNGGRWQPIWFNDDLVDLMTNKDNSIEITAIDTTPPTYSNAQTNTTVVGATVLFSILYDDNTALHPNGQYIFSTNNTSTWTNESAVNFTATPNWANVTKTLNSTEGISIGYRWYAEDNVGNSNNTGIYTLITTSADTCTYTSGNWAVDCSDNCTIDDNVNMGGNNISLIGHGDFSVNANITNFDKIFLWDNCEIRLYLGGQLR